MKVDFLIVGQGLAGSILAWHLIQKQCQVLVVDNSRSLSSSAVAAGLINPITGRRLVKSWLLEQCLPVAMQYYAGLEAERYAAGCSGEPIEDLSGGFIIREAGYLDTGALLESLKRYLQQRHSYRQDHFDYADLEVRQELVDWRAVTADRIIFCEGSQLGKNPWFSWLPLQSAQGEILTIKVNKPVPERIINRGKWLLPITGDTIKVGATYQWKPLDGAVTKNGKEELLRFFETVYCRGCEYDVLEHLCGIRPGTRDKKPFLGLHSQYPQLGVFNGFGSKGALMIPYFAKIFTDFLCEEQKLPQEVDISRFNYQP
jgi:glycine oxidase